jgi:hypothetical protein
MNTIETLRSVLDVLDASLIASCTCMTKTPDIEYHAVYCQYKARTLAVNDLTALIEQMEASERVYSRAACVTCGDTLMSDLTGTCYSCSNGLNS